MVVDTSVLPIRPKASTVKLFLEQKIQLDWSAVRCVQLNNMRNCTLIVLSDTETAASLAAAHNLKHVMSDETRQFPIPIYIDGAHVKVRVHDVHIDTPNDCITQKLRQYGEVISIESELWRRHFFGFGNGVRVIQMKLMQHIPPCVIINGEKTLVSYPNQPQNSNAQKESSNQILHQQQQGEKEAATSDTANQRQRITAAVDGETKATQKGDEGSMMEITPAKQNRRSSPQVHSKLSTKQDRTCRSDLASNKSVVPIQGIGFFASRDARWKQRSSTIEQMETRDDESDSDSDLETVSEFNESPKKTEHVPERRKKFFQ